MNNVSSFAPIGNEQAKILILGSMPSDASIQEQEYYAHQRNAFWPILISLFNSNSDQYNYTQRKNMLIKNNIALWDVLQSCYRKGSLDTAIQMDTVIVNDFFQFFSKHTEIKKVCFNGAKAEDVYLKYVLPTVKQQFGYLEYVRLPSTSPAHAAMTLRQKTDAWAKEIIAFNV
jgi:hypoxanthine-DNA glycosylase